MSPSCIAYIFFFFLPLLVLPAQHGSASAAYASYQLVSGQLFIKTTGKSSGNSPQASSTVPPATTCPSPVKTGLGKNKLPIVHRQSPCSPLHGLPSPTTADVLRRDTSRIRRRHFSSQSTSTVPAPASAPSPAGSIISIPTNGSSDHFITPPGALDYSVLVGYGTPEQRFPVFLDNTFGASVLWCKPCSSSGSGDCDPAFDASRSLTFAHVLCGSPDCPTANCSSGSVCPLVDSNSGTILGMFSRDMLTLTPNMGAVVDDFRFVCVGVEHRSPHNNLTEAGTLDLSRDRNSLPSRLSSSSSSPVVFSYCLPQWSSSQGFLSFGVVRDDHNNSTAAMVHAPLVSTEGNPDLENMYFVELVGMSVDGNDLPIPSIAFNNTGANLDLRTTFTLLPSDVYTPLRDAFRKEMARYNCSLPEFAVVPGFDTCYNFTALDEIFVPHVEFKFGNGESLVIHWDQILYFDNPVVAPFTVACLAFVPLDTGDNDGAAFPVIGTYTLASMEVVYDVAGGEVGFIPRSC